MIKKYKQYGFFFMHCGFLCALYLGSVISHYGKSKHCCDCLGLVYLKNVFALASIHEVALSHIVI